MFRAFHRFSRLPGGGYSTLEVGSKVKGLTRRGSEGSKVVSALVRGFRCWWVKV